MLLESVVLRCFIFVVSICKLYVLVFLVRFEFLVEYFEIEFLLN